MDESRPPPWDRAATQPCAAPDGGFPAPGETVAGRWSVVRALARGGAGSVHEALDGITGQRVALKFFLPGETSSPGRIRREIAALRLLRLPGIVRLLGESEDAGRRFLVMEYVEGRPFPGRAVPAAWDDVAATTLALLEAVARVHAAGVVHRDIKPANVLVDAAGRPTIVDFGISWGPALGARLTATGTIVGTPHYLAPEQILGQPADARSDLYAIGVLLHETLTGSLPHEGTDLGALISAKLTRPAPPLRRAAPGAPTEVAQAVDAMLATDPAARPRTAGEVVRILFGGQPTRAWGRRLPRLGTDAPVAALAEAAQAGRSLDVVGPRGSGRSRALEDAAARVEAAGRGVAWTAAGTRPFESVERIVGPAATAGASSLDEARAAVEAALRARLAQGTIVAADDPEALDRWSADSLGRCRDAGTVWRALPSPQGDHVRLTPLAEADLRGLFAGPDRVFFLPTDGAAVLWERTGGLPSRVATELAAWRRAGLVAEDGDRLAITREAIHALRGGLVVADATWAEALGPAARSAESDDVLAWVALAWPESTPSVLASASALPAWRIEAEVSALESDGCVRRLPDGRVQALGAPAGLAGWPAERRAAAHRALAAALPVRSLHRFRHLVASGDAAAVIAEAVPLGERLVADGRTGDALAVLAEALAVARAERVPGDEAPVLAEMAKAALSEATPRAVDRVLYELSRATRDAELAGAEELLRIVREIPSLPPDTAIARLDSLPPFVDETLELWRHAMRARAASGLPLAREAAELDRIEQWARATGSRRALASAASWRGLHLYQAQRYEEAARLHDLAFEQGERVPARLSACSNAAIAWTEAGRPEEAMRAARTGLALAIERRHARYAAAMEVHLRTTAYRSGAPFAADPELREAVLRLGVPEIDGEVALLDAAGCWRAGGLDEARRLAGEAAAAFVRSGLDAWTVLARAFLVLLGAPCGAQEALDLLHAARRCEIPTVGVQAAAMVPGPATERRTLFENSEARLPPGALRGRMEILDIAEARRLLEFDELRA